MKLPYRTSPLQKIEDELLNQKNIEMYVKRDELIHREIQGNKYRKLKYNMREAENQKQQLLLTFGGSFSNHIYAMAAAAAMLGFKCAAIIRGERPDNLSPTLQFASEKGMQLHFTSRSEYRNLLLPENLPELYKRFGHFYLVPEGGTNALALKGVAEIIDEINISFDYICTACGTGGTAAGLLSGLKGRAYLLGFSTLKGEDELTQTIKSLNRDFDGTAYHNFALDFHYHFGGYAKVKPELIDFIKAFRVKHNIQLDPVYTGKMFYGLFDMIGKNKFKAGSRIIALHTGGLQGLKGYSDYFDESLTGGLG
jgi:1-aminocyclopropane-1-carboxylate deaminase/D-cysteine desulfhydrase-like pyridoxal-dependent ACC family enzyme